MIAQKCGVLFCVLLLAGCGRDEAKLEEWVDSAWRERDFRTYDIDGKRDGDRTQAVATFVLNGGEKLHIELVVGYDPTPALIRANWSVDGVVYQNRSVVAIALKFTGGQGEGPSLGGRFALYADGQNRFRVTLPMQPVETPQWKME
jgi:hypothetical protein